MPNIAARVDAFQRTPISRSESELFAESALELRYGEDWKVSSPVRPADVVHPRRQENADFKDGRFYAVAVRPGDVAVAVPEPGTLGLMLAALGAGAVVRRRRSR